MYLQPVLNLLTTQSPLLGGLTTLFRWSPVLGPGTLPGGATFTRAGVAYQYDGTDFTQLGSGVIRDASVIAFGGAPGYLGEPEATNNLIDSDDYNAVAWQTAGLASITDDGINSIGLRQHTIVADTAAGVKRLLQVSVTAQSVYPFVKQSATNPIRFITVAMGASVGDYAAFDLQLGTVTEEANGAGYIKDLGGGWYQPTFIRTPVPLSGLPILSMSDTGTPGTASSSFTGASEELLVAPSNAEATNFDTSLIITGASPVTRAADIIDTGVVIPAEFGALFDFTAPATIGVGNTISLLGPDTSVIDILRLDEDYNVIMFDGGTPTIIGTVAANQRFKVSYGRDATSRSASLDGATAVAGDIPSGAHVGENFEVYSTAGANQARGIGHVSNIYSVRPTDGQLEQLSS